MKWETEVSLYVHYHNILPNTPTLNTDSVHWKLEVQPHISIKSNVFYKKHKVKCIYMTQNYDFVANTSNSCQHNKPLINRSSIWIRKQEREKTFFTCLCLNRRFSYRTVRSNSWCSIQNILLFLKLSRHMKGWLEYIENKMSQSRKDGIYRNSYKVEVIEVWRVKGRVSRKVIETRTETFCSTGRPSSSWKESVVLPAWSFCTELHWSNFWILQIFTTNTTYWNPNRPDKEVSFRVAGEHWSRKFYCGLKEDWKSQETYCSENREFLL